MLKSKQPENIHLLRLFATNPSPAPAPSPHFDSLFELLSSTILTLSVCLSPEHSVCEVVVFSRRRGGGVLLSSYCSSGDE